MASNERPIIKIDGQKIVGFWSFTMNSTMREFSDRFSMTLGVTSAEESLLWEVVKQGATVSTYIRNVNNSFIIDRFNRSESNGERIINIVGLSEEWYKGVGDSKQIKLIDVTDNDILSEVYGGGDFDGAVKLKEFDVGTDEDKNRTAERAAKENGFMLYATNGTVYKSKIDGRNGHYGTYSDEEVRGVQYDSGSLNDVYDKVVAVSVDNKLENILAQFDVNPVSGITGQSISTGKEKRIRMNASELGELQRQTSDITNIYKPKETVSFEVYDRDDIQLNQTARLKFNESRINATMVLYEKSFNVGRSGETTTNLHFAFPNRLL